VLLQARGRPGMMDVQEWSMGFWAWPSAIASGQGCAHVVGGVICVRRRKGIAEGCGAHACSCESGWRVGGGAAWCGMPEAAAAHGQGHFLHARTDGTKGIKPVVQWREAADACAAERRS